MDHEYSILRSEYSHSENTVLARTEEELIVLSQDMIVQNRINLDLSAKIVDMQSSRMHWNVIYFFENSLYQVFISRNTLDVIQFSQSPDYPHTARWNHNHSLVAVGSSEQSILTLYDAKTGDVIWRTISYWDELPELNIPPTLSVLGFNTDHTVLFTSSEYLLSSIIDVWDIDTGNILAKFPRYSS